MSRRARRLSALLALSFATVSTGWAQTFTPQSASRLTVSFTTERVGGGRVLVFGEVRNGSNAACERVIVSVEGLDENGRVVSRGRAYVFGTVPSRGSSPFELRMSSPGSERRFRVEIESYQFVSSGS
ncbi:MAG TPA: FxLYD domain-containing protein [Candidatus Deferrimicrobiaceae bacterium]|nr:FxLYD domain-containing protein [Candidatus Deferrimicrobiaceae bacterium]